MFLLSSSLAFVSLSLSSVCSLGKKISKAKSHLHAAAVQRNTCPGRMDHDMYGERPNTCVHMEKQAARILRSQLLF